MTVELDHAAYQFVRNFPDVMGIPAAVGKVRVPTVEVFRALLEELDQDPELAARIAARIKANVS
jgi:transcription antitermination factor NusG